MGKNKNTNEKEKKVAYSINDMGPVEREKKLLNPESESGKFLIILLVIVAFILMLWLVDTLKNNKNDEEEIKEVSIQYSEVLVGNMLSQKYDEYYVIAYPEEENKKDLIDYLMSLHLTSSHYYTLDLTVAQNLSSVAEESNFKTEAVNEIKFKGTTLLHIKKGKIEKAYEGADSIVDYLRSLKKESK